MCRIYGFYVILFFDFLEILFFWGDWGWVEGVVEEGGCDGRRLCSFLVLILGFG